MKPSGPRGRGTASQRSSSQNQQLPKQPQPKSAERSQSKAKQSSKAEQKADLKDKIEAKDSDPSATSSVSSTSRWSTQLPSRLVAHILTFTPIKTVATASSRVCKAWKQCDVNRVWQSCYLRDFEAETGDAKEIAVEGKETSWRKRYQRRKQTDQNRRAGNSSVSVIPNLPSDPIFMKGVGQHILIACRDHLVLLDANTDTIAKQTAIEDSGLERLWHVACQGNNVFAGFSSGDIAHFSLPDLKLVRVLPGTCGFHIEKISVGPGDLLLALTMSGELHPWSVSEGSLKEKRAVITHVHDFVCDWDKMHLYMYDASRAIINKWCLNTWRKVASAEPMHPTLQANSLVLLSLPDSKQQKYLRVTSGAEIPDVWTLSNRGNKMRDKSAIIAADPKPLSQQEKKEEKKGKKSGGKALKPKQVQVSFWPGYNSSTSLSVYHQGNASLVTTETLRRQLDGTVKLERIGMQVVKSSHCFLATPLKLYVCSSDKCGMVDAVLTVYNYANPE